MFGACCRPWTVSAWLLHAPGDPIRYPAHEASSPTPMRALKERRHCESTTGPVQTGTATISVVMPGRTEEAAAEASSPALNKCSAATKDEPMPDEMWNSTPRRASTVLPCPVLPSVHQILDTDTPLPCPTLGRKSPQHTQTAAPAYPTQSSTQGRATKAPQLEGGRDAGSGGRVEDSRASWTKTWHKGRELGLKTPTGACGGYRHTVSVSSILCILPSPFLVRV
ncbi:hypothetical protein B0T16DRAFT_10292 [Cercophora newfieldiana]|uniref:Uncharacterized protein n=1 Tax=Cercophora newfieldiana TaxID=92897 RepID=A0AA40D031_9PEZI|nr:hypothetical protein B0T16DRAFT_10292 [Cercophora newfieldiana]